MSFSLMTKDLNSMIYVANQLYKKLEEEGYLTMYNSELSDIVKRISSVSNTKYFVIVEGIAEHIVSSLDGAYKLRNNITESKTSKITDEYKIAIKDIAIKQLNVIIEYMEGKDNS